MNNIVRSVRRELRRVGGAGLAWNVTLLLGGLIGGWLGNNLPIEVVALITVLFLVSMGIFLLLKARNPIEAGVILPTPQAIRNNQDEKEFARRGYVGFVPLYRAPAGSAAENMSFDELKAAVLAFEFDKFDIPRSNFAPTIKAIKSHASKLEHCWLLSTKVEPVLKAKDGQEVPVGLGQSLFYAEFLVKYLREKEGLEQVCFHHDTLKENGPYTVLIDNDVALVSRTYDRLVQVFREATGMDNEIQPADMVADFTTAPRSMTLGMILACLNGDRHVQFVGTHYDEKGIPTRDLYPIIFGYETRL